VTARHRFDADYYRRHYEGRERVHSAAEVARLAAGVDGMAAWLGLPVRNVLEVGAGPGFWRAWYRRHRPSVRYRSTDFSEWASRRFGHERRDISRWRPRGAYDLVVCQGVLQYLEDEAAERAISNLAAASRGLLYLEVVTRHDLAHVVDPDRSDTVIHARSGAWYRRRLDAGFRQLGAGLWASRRAPVHFYELEAPPLSAARKPR
jgi:hypothetical protein